MICRSWLYTFLQTVLALPFIACTPLRQIATYITKRRQLAQSITYCCLLACASLLSSASIEDDKMLRIMQKRYGDEGVAILGAWQHLLSELDSAQQQTQIELINDFFNANIEYRDDVTLWQKTDYWATPLETLGKHAGDCEDFTIAKYMSLLQLGIPAEQLRLIYVKAQIGGPNSKIFQAHMVPGYYPTTDSAPLILDSLINRIEPATQRTDLRPVFSFNSEGLWVGNTQAQADPTARLSRWRDLLERAQAEGMHIKTAVPPTLTQVQQ